MASAADVADDVVLAPDWDPLEPIAARAVPSVTTATAARATVATLPGAGPRGRTRSIKSGPPKAPRRRTRAGTVPASAEALPAAPVALRIEDGSAIPVSVDADPWVAVTIPVEAPVSTAAHPMAIPPKPQMIAVMQSPAVERVRSTREQRIGDDGERLAAIRLEALGWRIVARNLRVSRAEVDILAIDPSDPPSLVLVEVRRRNRRDFGLAEETVDYRKRSAMRRAAGELAMRPLLPDGRRLPDLPVRVDLIAIDRGPDGRPVLRHHRGIEV